MHSIWYQVSHRSQQTILLDESECKHMQRFSFSSTMLSKWLTSVSVFYSYVPYCSCFFEGNEIGKEESSNLTKILSIFSGSGLFSQVFGQDKEWLN